MQQGLQPSREGGSRIEMLRKCILWYVGALAAAPLPALVFGDFLRFALAAWCVVFLPSMLGFVPLIWPSVPAAVPGYLPIIVISGYLIHMGVVSVVGCSSSQSVRRKSYLLFVTLLVIDVALAWSLPFVFLTLRGWGE
jgi:hypothetical protein